MLPGAPALVREFTPLPSQFPQIHRLKRVSRAAMLIFLASILLPAVSRAAAGMVPQQVVRNLPLSFEENRGQADPAFRYLLRYNGAEALFSKDRVDFRPSGMNGQAANIRMHLVNANAAPEAKDLEQGKSNYLIGADASKWIRGVHHFRQIEYNNLYPGISLSYYGNGDALEHDFQVAPGADPSQISFRFDGTEGVSISAAGDLEVRAAGHALTLHKPLAYQTAANGRTTVDAGFVLGKDDSVGFHLGNYDRTRPLVIDPVLVFSTYLAGTGIDRASAVATDASGNVYLIGTTSSTDFPTANPLQPHMGGCDTYAGCMNAFITKMNPTGTALIYSTYLGGSYQDRGGSIAVDGNGNAIVSGYAGSNNFPKAGAAPALTCGSNNLCYFLASLKPDGSALNYSGIFGVAGYEDNGNVGPVAVDNAGNAYLTGYTSDPNFKITAGTLAPGVYGYPYQELFILKVDSTGKLVYSTVVPGRATQDPATNNNNFIPRGIAVDTAGRVTVAGSAGPGLLTTSGVVQASFPYDTTNISQPTAGFVLQLSAAASSLTFASYLPDTNGAGALAVDSSGNLYFAGWTAQTSLPVSSNAYQKVRLGSRSSSGYVMKLSPKAVGVVAATYFDGTAPKSWEFTNFRGIALDSKGNIFVGGDSSGPDFPLQNPFTTVRRDGVSSGDMVLAAVNPSMSSLLFGSFLNSTEGAPAGASSFSGMAIDNTDKLVVAGTTYALNFPTTVGSFEPELPPAPNPGSYGVHSFIAKMDMATPAPSACLSSLSIALGSLVAGNSGTQTLNVTNCGNAPLDLLSIVSSDPTVKTSQNCGSIAPGSVCPITLTFKPVVDGYIMGTVTITDNAVLPPPVVAFSGAGHAPKILANPSSVVFPAQVLGVSASGASFNLFIQNTGGELLVINTLTATGDFSVITNGCTSPVTPGSNCVIQLRFTPTQVGQSTGTLSIASNDPGNPVLAVGLSGNASAAYPVANISLLWDPAYPVTSGTTPIRTMVWGTNFFPSSVVYVNGVAQPTTYESDTSLYFSLSPSLLNAMAEIPVTVLNPAPGGGSSASYPLIAYLSIPLESSALVLDPVGGLLYAAIPASATQNANTVIPINPATGAMMTPIAVSKDPQRLAISDDGSELYVATSAGVLQRFNLKTLALEKTFSLPVDPSFGQTYVQQMQVVPGTPKSIVVSVFANVSSPEDGAALYNDSGLVNWIPGSWVSRNWLDLNAFTFTTPTTIYGVPQGGTFFSQLQVGADGLSVISPSGAGCCDQYTGSLLSSDGTLLYTNSGEVWNPTTQTLLGTYLQPKGEQLFYSGKPLPDIANKHTYFLDTQTGYADYGSLDIDVYNSSTYALENVVPFVETNLNSATDLVRWGSNGFAFRNYDTTGFAPQSDQIVILTTSKVKSSSGAPVPIVSSVTPSSVFVGGPAFTMQVIGSGFTSASTVLINHNHRSTTFVNDALLTVQVPALDIATAGDMSVQVTTPAPGGGTSNYGSSSVNKQSPVVTVTPSSFNLTTSQSLELSVSVSGATGYPTPTGSVALSSDVYSSAPVTLSGGSATIHVPAGALVVGTEALTITYTPDSASASLYNRTSGVTTVSVGAPSKSTPTVSAMFSPSTITTAQILTVTVAVNGGNGNPTPTGSLTIAIGTKTLAGPACKWKRINQYRCGSAARGQQYALNKLHTGHCEFVHIQRLDRDRNDFGYSSGEDHPNCFVTPSASNITTAQPLTVTVAVNGGSGNPAPTGSVTLSGGGFTSTPAKLSSGSTTISIAAGALATGTDTLTASFVPDTTSSTIYNSSTGSATVAVSAPVGTVTPVVTVTPSAGTITDAQSLNVNITVAGVTGQAAPTGTIILSSGSYSAQQALSNGGATFTIAAGALSSGTDYLTAGYAGDTTYASASGTATVTVSQVSIASPVLSPVSPGGNVQSTVSVSAGSNYSGTMNLTCTLIASPTHAVSLPTCTLNPTSVSLATGSSVATSLTVKTTAATSAAASPSSLRGLKGLGGGAALAAFLIFVSPRRRRVLWMAVLCLGVAMAGTTGCGGGSSSGGAPPIVPATPATTTGNYTFAVTGTDSADAKITASASVTITVQ